jgi:lysozyme
MIDFILFLLKDLFTKRGHMTKYNIERLKDQLEFDEGVVYEIYICPTGQPTFGVGHMIKSRDPEYGLPVGTAISHERVWEAFRDDVEVAIKDCEDIYNDFYSFPAEVQEVLINMCFNLGKAGLAGFKKMKQALEKGDWSEAAKEGRDSKWYRQVSRRAERLMSRLEKIDE